MGGVLLNARSELPDADRAYAQEKFEKLAGRFAGVHEMRVTLQDEGHLAVTTVADAVVHLHHSHFAARAEGATVREAVDRLVAKVDRNLTQRKERVTGHRAG